MKVLKGCASQQIGSLLCKTSRSVWVFKNESESLSDSIKASSQTMADIQWKGPNKPLLHTAYMYKTYPDVPCTDKKSLISTEELSGNGELWFLECLKHSPATLLGLKLTAIQPDNAKVSWIIDYLADRPQFVPFWSNILDLLLQWGTVLSPALFAIYLLTRDSTVGQTTSRFSLMIPPLWSASREEERWWGWLTVCICCMWISVWYKRQTKSFDQRCQTWPGGHNWSNKDSNRAPLNSIIGNFGLLTVFLKFLTPYLYW